MLEIRSKPISEVQKPPDEVISKIAELYSSDMNKVYSKEAEEERNKEWDSVAKKFSDYSGIIKELGKVIIEVNKKKKEFPQITEYVQNFFGDVGEGRDFLGDLWCSRIAPSADPIEIIVNGGKEARNMFGEMGIPRSICGKTLEKVTFEKAVSLVLQGKPKLKPTPQPK